MVDAGDDADGHVEATLVTAAPHGFGRLRRRFGETDCDRAAGRRSARRTAPDDCTTTRTARRCRATSRRTHRRPAAARQGSRQPPPAALAAKIHAPAVSELRKPRPSRRTPPGGSPQPPATSCTRSCRRRSSEPMPVPRAAPPPPTPPAAIRRRRDLTAGADAAGHQPQPMPPDGPRMPDRRPHAIRRACRRYAGHARCRSRYNTRRLRRHAARDPDAAGAVGRRSRGTPDRQPPYHARCPGLPSGSPMPPGLRRRVAGPAVQRTAYDPQYAARPGDAAVAARLSPAVAATRCISSSRHRSRMSLTGQMRLFEVDEIPSQYKLGAARRRWFTYIVSRACSRSRSRPA